MKILVLFFTLLVFFSFKVQSQSPLKTDAIAPAPSDKAVVYFTRTSSTAFLITFTLFDSAKLVGDLPVRKYIRYECEPGTHVFWAISENRDFINATLEAGKIYVVDSHPQMGAFTAGVKVVPIDGKNPKQMKSILKLMSKKGPIIRTEDQLASDVKLYQHELGTGLAKYAQEKAKGKKNLKLTANMNYK